MKLTTTDLLDLIQTRLYDLRENHSESEFAAMLEVNHLTIEELESFATMLRHALNSSKLPAFQVK